MSAQYYDLELEGNDRPMGPVTKKRIKLWVYRERIVIERVVEEVVAG